MTPEREGLDEGRNESLDECPSAEGLAFAAAGFRTETGAVLPLGRADTRLERLGEVLRALLERNELLRELEPLRTDETMKTSLSKEKTDHTSQRATTVHPRLADFHHRPCSPAGLFS